MAFPSENFGPVQRFVWFAGQVKLKKGAPFEQENNKAAIPRLINDTDIVTDALLKSPEGVGILLLLLMDSALFEDAIKLLLERGVPLCIASKPAAKVESNDMPRGNALHYAARYTKSVNIFSEIIARLPTDLKDAEELFDAKDSDGYTALALAARYNNGEILNLLLDYAQQRFPAKDVLVKPYIKGKSLLHLAAEGDEPSAVEALLDRGLKCAEMGPSEPYTPLHVAARKDSPNTPQIIALLLAKGGVTVDVQSSAENLTPAHLAVTHESAAALRALIQAGADLSIGDKDGDSPLMLAREKDNPDIIQIIETAEKDHRSDSAASPSLSEDSEVVALPIQANETTLPPSNLGDRTPTPFHMPTVSIALSPAPVQDTGEEIASWTVAALLLSVPAGIGFGIGWGVVWALSKLVSLAYETNIFDGAVTSLEQKLKTYCAMPWKNLVAAFSDTDADLAADLEAQPRDLNVSAHAPAGVRAPIPMRNSSGAFPVPTDAALSSPTTNPGPAR